jgi:hypothetical protein
MLTRDLLLELFEYRDGILYWKISKAFCIQRGDVAGTINSKGYHVTSINYKPRLNHRLVFLMHHGYLPKMIDHIDGDKLNNRIENLRPANPFENACNSKLRSKNKSGYPGVSWSSQSGKWKVTIQIAGKKMHVGFYTSLEEAGKVSIEIRKENHGEFYREMR